MADKVVIKDPQTKTSRGLDSSLMTVQMLLKRSSRLVPIQLTTKRWIVKGLCPESSTHQLHMQVVTITFSKVNQLVAALVGMVVGMVPTKDKEEDELDGMVEVETA